MVILIFQGRISPVRPESCQNPYRQRHPPLVTPPACESKDSFRTVRAGNDPVKAASCEGKKEQNGPERGSPTWVNRTPVSRPACKRGFALLAAAIRAATVVVDGHDRRGRCHCLRCGYNVLRIGIASQAPIQLDLRQFPGMLERLQLS